MRVSSVGAYSPIALSRTHVFAEKKFGIVTFMGCKVTIHKSLFVPLYRCRLSVAQIRFVQGKVGNRSQCKSHRLWDSVAPTALHLGELLIPSAMRWADNIARLQHLHYILYQDNMVSIHPNYLFSFHVTPSFVSFTSKPSLANSSRMRSLVDQSLSALALARRSSTISTTLP